MYILMISRGFPTKDYPQWGCFEKDQAEALAAYGHKVIVLSVDARLKRNRGNLGLHHFHQNGVEYYNYVILPGVFFSKIVGYDFYLRHIKIYYFNKVFRNIVAKYGKPDVLYAHYICNIIIGGLLKKGFNIPLVGIEHWSGLNNEAMKHTVINMGKHAYPNVDKLIAVSISLKERIRHLFGIDSVVVHNMIGAEFLKVPPRNIQKNDFSMISVGTLLPVKGYDILIKAMNIVAKNMPSAHLTIIGEGPEHEHLQKMIDDYGLSENVSLLGKKGKLEIVQMLNRSSLYISSSRSENFSVSVLEALAVGIPVIATLCGGIRECVNEKNGVLIPVEDVDSMANAILQMGTNIGKYDRKIISNDCKANFSPQVIARQLTNVIENVICSSVLQKS